LGNILYYKTKNLAGDHLRMCLGSDAFTNCACMGTGSDLAVLHFLMFVSELAPPFVVAGNIGNFVRAWLSELPALNRGNNHSIDCVPILKSSSGRCFDLAALLDCDFLWD